LPRRDPTDAFQAQQAENGNGDRSVADHALDLCEGEAACHKLRTLPLEVTLPPMSPRCRRTPRSRGFPWKEPEELKHRTIDCAEAGVPRTLVEFDPRRAPFA